MYRIRINLWILYYITPCIKAKFLNYMKDWWNKNNISRWFDMISPSTGLNNNMNTFDKKYSWIRKYWASYKNILLFSFECGGRKSSNAKQRGGRRNSSESGRWEHKHFLWFVHLFLDWGGEAALVVRQLVGALHGAVGQNRLWPVLLWWVVIIIQYPA